MTASSERDRADQMLVWRTVAAVDTIYLFIFLASPTGGHTGSHKLEEQMSVGHRGPRGYLKG